MLEVILVLLILSGAAYTVIALICVKRFFNKEDVHEQVTRAPLPVSILKPIRGLDPSCSENLLSFCVQDYPQYEVLFGFREGDDPAIPVASRIVGLGLCDARLVVDSQGSGPNKKVLNMDSLAAEAQHSLLVLSDSDMCVDKDYLRRIVAEFESGKKTGIVTSLYKISDPESVGSALESLTIALDFIPSVLVARRLEGITFGLGASMLLSKDALQQIGGLRPIREYLADDYQIGFRLAKRGYENILSRYVIENRIGSMGIREHLVHQLRWARTYRASRPKGFVGFGVTHMFFFALLLAVVEPAAWTFAVVALVLMLRYALALTVYASVIRKRGWLKWLFLVPFKDLSGFVVWLRSFMGSKVHWRGDRYRIIEDGKIVGA